MRRVLFCAFEYQNKIFTLGKLYLYFETHPSDDCTALAESDPAQPRLVVSLNGFWRAASVSKVHLQSEFEHSRIKRSRNRAERGCAEAGVWRTQRWRVRDVECFCA